MGRKRTLPYMKMSIMKNIGIRFSLMSALLVVLPVFAAEAAVFRAGGDYQLRSGETVAENLYSAGRTAVIEGTVNGDLLLLGGNLTVSGPVSKDAAILGGNVTISGSIGDDLRVAGGSVVVSGPIHGDLVVAGGSVHVTSNARIGGDLLAAGGRVTIDGAVSGRVEALGGSVVLNGNVTKDVFVQGAKSLALGEHADLGGNLTYRGTQELTRAPGAVVHGAVDFQKLTSRGAGRPIWLFWGSAFLGVWWVLKLIIGTVSALLLFFFFRRQVSEIVLHAGQNFGRSLLTGFLVLVATPVAAVLLLASLIGSIFGIIIGFAYITWLILAGIGGGILLGAFAIRLISRAREHPLDWKVILLGMVLLAVLGLVPVLGWILVFLLFLAVLGAMADFWYRHIWLNR